MKAEFIEKRNGFILRVSGDVSARARYPILPDIDYKDNVKLARSQTIQYILQQIRDSIEKALDE